MADASDSELSAAMGVQGRPSRQALARNHHVCCLPERGEEITRLSSIQSVDIRPLLTYKAGRGRRTP